MATLATWPTRVASEECRSVKDMIITPDLINWNTLGWNPKDYAFEWWTIDRQTKNYSHISDKQFSHDTTVLILQSFISGQNDETRND